MVSDRGVALSVTGRNRFLPRQNLSDPFYDFLDGFYRLRMVVEKIKNISRIALK
jgi:hypothetical protein